MKSSANEVISETLILSQHNDHMYHRWNCAPMWIEWRINFIIGIKHLTTEINNSVMDIWTSMNIMCEYLNRHNLVSSMSVIKKFAWMQWIIETLISIIQLNISISQSLKSMIKSSVYTDSLFLIHWELWYPYCTGNVETTIMHWPVHPFNFITPATHVLSDVSKTMSITHHRILLPFRPNNNAAKTATCELEFHDASSVKKRFLPFFLGAYELTVEWY